MACLRPTIKKTDFDTNAPSSTDQSEMYRIPNSVIKRLRARYRDIASEDIGRLIDALISDISMFDGIETRHQVRVRDLEQELKELKAIKATSANSVLFPNQKKEAKEKQTALHSVIQMLKREVSFHKKMYDEAIKDFFRQKELLKIAKLEIARLNELLMKGEK